MIPLFIFTACPEVDGPGKLYYNYGGKPVSFSFTVKNNTSEDITFSADSYDQDEISGLVNLSSDEEITEQTLAAGEKATKDLILVDDGVLWLVGINCLKNKLYYQSMIGTITYKDGSSKKFTGYDFDSLSIPSLNKDDFELSGFGYYKINTSVENADNTFGTFVSPDENANGIKEGVIYLTIEVNDEGLSYSYANE